MKRTNLEPWEQFPIPGKTPIPQKSILKSFAVDLTQFGVYKSVRGCTRTVRTPKYAFPRIYTPFHGAAPITIYVKKRITQWLASICAILGEYVGALTPEHSELPGAILHPPRYQPLWPLQRPAEDQQLDSPGLGSR